jgi:hypothetical protein
VSRFLTSLVQVGLLTPLITIVTLLVIDFHKEGMARIRNYDLRQENK